MTSLLQRLDTELHNFVECFANLIKAARLETPGHKPQVSSCASMPALIAVCNTGRHLSTLSLTTRAYWWLYCKTWPVLCQGERAPGDLLEVLTEKLIISGQLCVTLIAELKQNAVVNDFKALNQGVAALTLQHQQNAVQLQSHLQELQLQLRHLQQQTLSE